MIEPGVILNSRYRVLRQIGEGGMGAVWEGEHTGVGRHVAIKVLHSQYAKQPEIVGRFEREARAAAAIGHDNIIDVLDVGTHDGTPFMIMEFLKGESLGARIEARGRLPVPEALHVMTQVLSALNAAHSAGIVHRDLKPDNVYLIQRAGVADFVKLLDFGVSKFKSEPGESKGLTQTGAMMGTPYYMAPEQALAKRDIDHRADIYSAGVMLYQLVTGTLPFLAESQAELLMAIVYQPYGITPPRQHNPEIPAALEAVILRAMCKEREGRFADCSEFAAALAAMDLESAAGIGAGSLGGALTGAHAPGATPHNTTPLGWETAAQAARRTTGQQAQQSGSVPVAVMAPKRGRGAMLAAGAGLAVALVAGGVFAMRAGHGGTAAVHEGARGAVVATEHSADTAALARAERDRAAAAEQAAAQRALEQRAEEARRAPVSIDLDGVPVGATIEVDGQVVSTPHLSFAPSTAHAIRVTATGMQPYETRVTAERDRTIVIALMPSAVAAPEGSAVAVAPAGPRRDAAGARTHGIAGRHEPAGRVDAPAFGRTTIAPRAGGPHGLELDTTYR